jgi:hypothetical protein
MADPYRSPIKEYCSEGKQEALALMIVATYQKDSAQALRSQTACKPHPFAVRECYWGWVQLAGWHCHLGCSG